MSYSFSLRAASVAALLAAAVEKMGETVKQQPVHAVDCDAALKNLEAHAKLVGEPADGEELAASMHGSVGGEIDWNTGEVRRLSTAGSGCTVYKCLATAAAG